VQKYAGTTGTYLPTYDGNGNVSEYIHASYGSNVAHYEYGPFGEQTVATGSLSTAFRHRFSTKPLDEETGYYYYGYRSYDPLGGRWMGRDPIEESGGVNLYGMLGNAMIVRSDKLGLEGIDVKACGCGKEVLNKKGHEMSIEAAQKRKADVINLPKDAAPGSTGREFGGRLCCDSKTKKIEAIWAPHGEWTPRYVDGKIRVYEGIKIDVEAAPQCSTLGSTWNNAGTFHGHGGDAGPSNNDVAVARFNPPAFIGGFNHNGDPYATRTDPWNGPTDAHGIIHGVGVQTSSINPNGAQGTPGPPQLFDPVERPHR
jgi:RHS repeat-associated protein